MLVSRKRIVAMARIGCAKFSAFAAARPSPSWRSQTMLGRWGGVGGAGIAERPESRISLWSTPLVRSYRDSALLDCERSALDLHPTPNPSPSSCRRHASGVVGGGYVRQHRKLSRNGARNAAMCFLAVIGTSAALAADKDPAVPPGRDPGGVAIAIIGPGLDYTLPKFPSISPATVKARSSAGILLIMIAGLLKISPGKVVEDRARLH